MKIAYLFSHDIYSNDGVIKKIKSQYEIWNRLNVEVKLFCMQDKEYNKSKHSILKGVDVHICLKNKNPYKRVFLLKEIVCEIEKYNPDIIYLRYEPFKLGLNRLMNKFKTVIEINSLDTSELELYKNFTVKDKIKYFYNSISRNLLFSKASGFVFKSFEMQNLPEFSKYSKKSIVVPNSINLNNFQIQKKVKNMNSIPSLFFIGTVNQDWHGIDKIEYLASKTIGILNFHIVGEDKEDKENIFYYGYLQKEEYLKIMSKCDIGIGTLALHRKDMHEASSLKVREYLACGLPIILAYKDTHLINKDFKWLLNLPNNENNIENNIDKIIEFSNDLKNHIVFHDEIKFIDVSCNEKLTIDFFKRLVYEKNFN